MARGRTIPFRWDGSLKDFPHGIDAVGLRAVDDPQTPTILSALSAEVVPDQQGKGLSRLVLLAMAEVARQAGGWRLSLPPSARVGRIATPSSPWTGTGVSWKMDDSLPFDPWLRVHARLGATLLRAEPKSMRIEAPVHDWEQWTGMALPGDGDYVFPSGLTALRCPRWHRRLLGTQRVDAPRAMTRLDHEPRC